jgi:hypothetical protein
MDTLSEIAAGGNNPGPSVDASTGPGVTNSTAPWALDDVKSSPGDHPNAVRSSDANDFLASLFPVAKSTVAHSVVSEPPINRHHRTRKSAKDDRTMMSTFADPSEEMVNEAVASVLMGSHEAHHESSSSPSVKVPASASTSSGRRRTPEWIRRVFEFARNGDVRSLVSVVIVVLCCSFLFRHRA